MGVGGQRHFSAALRPGKTWHPIAQEAGWDTRPVRADAENLVRTEIRSQGRPALASRYIDRAIPVPSPVCNDLKTFRGIYRLSRRDF